MVVKFTPITSKLFLAKEDSPNSRVVDGSLFVSRFCALWIINPREYRKENHKQTTQTNRQHSVYKTKTKKHNTIYVGQRYAQTNTNDVNKTWALLQTTFWLELV